MKNMKRVISTLLMLSMMAALLCVPAFADDVASIQITAGNVQAGTYADVPVTAQLMPMGASNIAGPFNVVWYLNDQYIWKSENITNGICSIALTEAQLSRYENTIKAEIEGWTNVCGSCNVYNDNNKPVPDLGAQDKITFENNTNNMVVTYGDTSKSIKAYINGVLKNDAVNFFVQEDGINVIDVSEWGDIITKDLGTATVIVSKKGNPDIMATYTVQVVSSVPDPSNVPTTVSINPIPTTLQKGQTINISASVNGSSNKAVFDRWVLDSRDAAYVSLGYDQAQSTTLTARAATSSPVTLYAYAKDGTSTYVQFTIAANENMQLAVSDENIYYDYAGKAKTSIISVANAFVGEEFTWNIVPSAQYGVLAGSNNYGSSVEVTAGPLEGRVNVTATSKADATRTATATVYVNVESQYGGASITPAVATWQRGQAALKFTVSPNYYYAYLDNKPLTPESRSYTYYNGVLTLSTGLLSGLSSGEHVLKVYTSSGNGQDGLVYATIYITGSASNVYGDNAHVRGSAYNLYFTSTDPIKEVYISNQWIDPANYTLTNNGTGLTLKSDFLNKLGYGSYSMRLVTQNGYNQNASFRIVTANYAPATGDDANMGAWMALLILSLAGAVVLIPKRKKSTDLIG